MTKTFVSLRRITALSVAITLFAAPIASAQSRASTPPRVASANTVLLNEAAFARFLQPPSAGVAPVPVVAVGPRLSLLRQSTAMARAAGATAAKAPQQKSWVSRHKTISAVLIGIGAFFGAVLINCAATSGCED